ncbi:MAG TPA: serine protease [bacterium]|nr:serine protease [bacterium]
MRSIAHCMLLLVVPVLLLIPLQPSAAQPSSPGDAVFQIRVVQFFPMGVHWTVAQGTGFFVASDGTALTNSHVVYPVVRDPQHYQLIAIVGPEDSAEFYGVAVDCASTLSYDPAQLFRGTAVMPARDVARIHIVPSTLPVTTWTEFSPTGRRWPIARSHVGPLPSFPALRVAGAAVPGMHVRVTGYGPRVAPVEKETLSGQVAHRQRTEDGTQIFSVALENRPPHGYSGSPVLDDDDRVVGMWTWSASPDSTALGSAQADGALIEPCR